MNEKMPHTPFSTPLSGSAKETEIRIRNIMSGPKKRPPVLFLALMFSVCIFCGNLVSCQMKEPDGANVPDRLSNSQQGDVSLDLEEHEPASVTYEPGEDPLSEGEQKLLDTLFRTAERQNGYQFQSPTAQLMSYIQKDGWVLGAVFVEDYWENTLILGIMDKETGEMSHGVFQRSVKNGVPSVVTFRDSDGEYCLLYTFNGQENGQYTGQAGVVRFAGAFMEWQWPVEGDVRYGIAPPDGPEGAYSEYEAYWDDRLAVMAPGGVDVYTVNPEFEWGKDEPWSMWQLEYGETFYADPSSAEELPMPVYFQSLNWLNEHTNDPGGWQIVSLVLNEEKCDAGKRVDCYTLRARSWTGAEDLTADLFFPYEQTGSRRSYDGLDRGEKLEQVSPNPDDLKSDKADDWNWVWDDNWNEEWEKEQEAKQIAEYQSVGVTMDGKNYYYQGQLVNIFLDQRPDKSVYTLDRNPAGTVNVKILRSDDGTITGAAYLTEAEAAELSDSD